MKDLIVDQVAVNYRKADLTPGSAMLAFAVHVSTPVGEIVDADLDPCAHTASPMTTSGTSAPSPRSSPCPTAWRT
jgi:hypothetical protein